MSAALSSLLLHAVALASAAPEEAPPVTPVVFPIKAPVPTDASAAAAPPSDPAMPASAPASPVVIPAIAAEWTTPGPIVLASADGGAPEEEAPSPGAAAPAPAEQPADASALAAPSTVPGATVDDPMIDGRRRPGVITELPPAVTQNNPGAVRAPPPEAFPTDQFPVPDRWRLAKALCPDKNYVGIQNVCHSPFDPYHQNSLKGDRPIQLDKKPFFLPITGDDWFFSINAISDTIIEPRSFPTPVADQTSEQPGAIGQFGRQHSLVLAQTFIFGANLTKGSTAYKPPDVEYRFALAYQVNHVDVEERRVLNVRSSKASRRTDSFLGVQELFIDYHLGNRSDRYDFDSIRVGIQPFQFDFRGFLFQDNQLGFRFFGNRDNNRYQFNLQAIWRLEKDTNSGLNDVTRRPREDYVLHANLFAQDFPLAGLTSLVSVTANWNRERDERKLDHNGFPVRPALLGDQRPREYDVYYLGYSLDGRVKRFNLSSSVYLAFGEDRNNFFTSKPAKIRSAFAAAEFSYDFDWIRVKLSGLYTTGDSDPKDNTEGGFSAIFENPIFAGADTSYYIRQVVPFAGGGINTALSPRNGIINDLRTSKEEGQSNFNNPGTVLLGIGADFDLTPQLRVSTNVNHLWFENTATIRELRNEGSVPKSIGWDVSTAIIYRPTFIQNIVFRLSGAVFDPGKGFTDLFTNSRRDDRYYSVLFNAILSF